MLTIPPDLDHFLKLARDGASSEAAINASVLADTTIERLADLDPAAVRGFVGFIGVANVDTGLAARLLSEDHADLVSL